MRAELTKRQEEIIKNHEVAGKQAIREIAEQWEVIAGWANMILPVGWLPLGVKLAAEGAYLPSMLALSGMSLIGIGSLWRRITQQSGFTRGNSPVAAAVPRRGVRARW